MSMSHSELFFLKSAGVSSNLESFIFMELKQVPKLLELLKLIQLLNVQIS